MRTRFVLILAGLLALLVTLPNPLAAEPVSVPRYGWVVNGYVDETIARGNTVYLSGGFTAMAPLQNRVGRYVELTLGSGHPVRLPAEVGGGQVAAIVEDGAGGWYLGGDFTTVGGVARAALAHLRADGTLDPAFSPALVGTVRGLLRRGGTLFATGNFTAVNGQARGGGAAFDIASGALLPWNPQLQVSATAAGNALTGVGSSIFIGGTFTSVAGNTRWGLAAVDDTSGALLPLVADVGGVGPGLVLALASRGTTVYVGGAFGAINGTPRASLGAIDASTGAVLPYQADANGLVMALLASPNGVYVAGNMTTIGGQTRRFLGLTDAVTGAVAAWHPDANAAVRTLALSGDSLLFAGDFTYVAGNGRAHVAAVQATGSGTLQAWNPGLSHFALTLAVGAGGTVAVGGAFTHHGASARLRLAAIDLVSGDLQPLAARINGNLFDIDLAGQTLYLAGNFTAVNGIARTGFAALDADTGAVLPWDPQASAALGRSLAVVGNAVYLGGFFSAIGGQARQGFAQVDAVTGAPTGFVMNASGASGVLEIRPQGTRLFLGGNFTSLGGQARTGLAALDTTTNALTGLAPVLGGTTVSVNAIAPSGDTLYIAGTFASAGGQARTNVAAIAISSGAVLPFAPVVDQSVFGLDVRTDTVYLAGNFTTVNGQPREMAAAVDATTGTTTRAFHTGGFNGQGRHVSAGPEGLWVGANAITTGVSHLLFFPESAMGGLPGAPSTPTVNISGPTLTLRWSPSSVGGAPLDYIVEAGTAPGSSNVATLPLGSTTPRFTFTPVPGGRYYLRVRARSAAGVGAPSAEVAFSAGVAGCAGPPQAVLAHTTVSGGAVDLFWEDPVSAGSGLGYVLEAGSAPRLANIATVNLGGARTFAATAPPGLYFARVRASSPCGVAPASPDVVIAVGGVSRLLPPVVTGQVAGGAVSITWDAVAGATAYRLEAGSGPLGTNLATVTVPGTSLNAIVAPGTYYVRVSALGAAGASAPSKELVLIVP